MGTLSIRCVRQMDGTTRSYRITEIEWTKTTQARFNEGRQQASKIPLRLLCIRVSEEQNRIIVIRLLHQGAAPKILRHLHQYLRQ